MYRADAPGRVNLIGEHTDYNEGLVLPTATPQRTVVELSPREDRIVRVESEGYMPVAYRLGEERHCGDWGDYVRGVTWVLTKAGHPIRGFDAGIASRVPPGAGLSSSAALDESPAPGGTRDAMPASKPRIGCPAFVSTQVTPRT